jgi:hypothetical protein
MRVERAEIKINEGHPELLLSVDGRQASVFQPKRTLLNAGIVILLAAGDDSFYWEDSLPPVTARAKDGSSHTFRGAVTDPVIVKLAREFSANESRRAGRVPVPTPSEAAADPGPLFEVWEGHRPQYGVLD